MQELLDHNDIFMYFTNNEGNSVVAERFKTTAKGKIATNDSKSYLGYFSQLVDEYSNTIIEYSNTILVL